MLQEDQLIYANAQSSQREILEANHRKMQQLHKNLTRRQNLERHQSESQTEHV